MAVKLKKQAKATKTNKQKSKVSVIKLWDLYKLSWLEISTFWRPLLSVIAVYAVLSFILISGFALLPSADSINNQIEDFLGAEAGRLAGSLTLVGLSIYDVASPSNTLMQILLFLIASMAFVWALRKLRGLKKFKIRQAYYEGTSNIIAMAIVILLLLLTFIPASIAAAALSYGLAVANSTIETSSIYAFSAASTALTLYFLAVWWPAFYIIMLPGTTPVNSFRAAAELTKRIRAKLFVKQMAIFITLVLLFLSIVVPVSLIWQRLIPLTVYLVIFSLFGVLHIMMFTLYRSLVDAKQGKG